MIRRSALVLVLVLSAFGLDLGQAREAEAVSLSTLPAMRLRSVLRSMGAVGLIVLSVFVLAGCGRPVGAPPGLGKAGWTQLPDSPLSPMRVGSLAFWAGDRLIVAGGADLGDADPDSEVRKVEPTGQTVAFLPATNAWVEESPLVVPGFDGVMDAVGVWMGTYWLGVGAACRTNSGLLEDVRSECRLQ